MSETPYARFERKELILRDELAIDRTVLANERTMLAYVRTALTLFIAGVTFIEFIESSMWRSFGYFFIPVGVLVGIFGAWRCRRMGRAIQSVRKAASSPP